MPQKIAVLLSTFNGEKYIASQLDSILKQEGNFIIDIFVRDDGSSDSTLEIIKELSEVNRCLHLREGENIGYKLSFFDLLYTVADYDFYAFCDQDDVWLSTKLKASLRFLEKQNFPSLYACKKYYVNEVLKPLSIKDKSLPMNLDYGFFRGGICGCTMVWNNKLQQIIQRYRPKESFKSHDDYVRCLAIAIGASTYLDETPHILYRRHSKNESLLPNSRLRRILVKGIKDFGSRADLKKISLDLIRGYSDELTTEAKSFLEQIIAKDSLNSRLSLIRSPHLKTCPPYEEYLLKTLILLRGID